MTFFDRQGTRNLLQAPHSKIAVFLKQSPTFFQCCLRRSSVPQTFYVNNHHSVIVQFLPMQLMVATVQTTLITFGISSSTFDYPMPLEYSYGIEHFNWPKMVSWFSKTARNYSSWNISSENDHYNFLRWFLCYTGQCLLLNKNSYCRNSRLCAQKLR